MCLRELVPECHLDEQDTSASIEYVNLYHLQQTATALMGKMSVGNLGIKCTVAATRI